jgi:hypothetical protein
MSVGPNNARRANAPGRRGSPHNPPYPPIEAGDGALSLRCEYQLVTVHEAVRNVVAGTWDVPPFQRGFIWKPWQVCELADSLWRDYPVGQLLLWKDPKATGRVTRRLVADGQHRLVSLCLLFGEEPHWWHDERATSARQTARQYDVRFDLEATRPPFFREWPRDTSKPAPASLVSLKELLAIDLEKNDGQNQLEEMASRLAATISSNGTLPGMRERLASVCRIREKHLTAAILNHQSEQDVLEVFERLSGGGIRFRRLLLRLVTHKFLRRSSLR